MAGRRRLHRLFRPPGRRPVGQRPHRLDRPAELRASRQPPLPRPGRPRARGLAPGPPPAPARARVPTAVDPPARAAGPRPPRRPPGRSADVTRPQPPRPDNTLAPLPLSRWIALAALVVALALA